MCISFIYIFQEPLNPTILTNTINQSSKPKHTSVSSLEHSNSQLRLHLAVVTSPLAAARRERSVVVSSRAAGGSGGEAVAPWHRGPSASCVTLNSITRNLPRHVHSLDKSNFLILLQFRTSLTFIAVRFLASGRVSSPCASPSSPCRYLRSCCLPPPPLFDLALVFFPFPLLPSTLPSTGFPYIQLKKTKKVLPQKACNHAHWALT